MSQQMESKVSTSAEMRSLDKPSYYEDILKRCGQGESLKAMSDLYEVEENTLRKDLRYAASLVRQGKIRLYEKQQVADMQKEFGALYASLIKYVQRSDYTEPPERKHLPGLDTVRRSHVSYYELLLQHMVRGASPKGLVNKYGIKPGTITMDLLKALSMAKQGQIRLIDTYYFGKDGVYKNSYEELISQVDEEGYVSVSTVEEKENASTNAKDYDPGRLSDKLSYYEDILRRYGQGELLIDIGTVYNVTWQTIRGDIIDAANLVRKNSIRLLEKQRTSVRSRRHDILYDALIEHVHNPAYIEPPEREPLPVLDSVVRSEKDSYYDLILRYGARGADPKFLAEKCGTTAWDIENDFGTALLLVKKGKIRLVEKNYFGRNKIHAEIYGELARQANEEGYIIGASTQKKGNLDGDFVQKRLMDKASYYEDVLELCGQGKTMKDIAAIYQVPVHSISQDLSIAKNFVLRNKLRLHEKEWVNVREKNFMPVYKELVAHVKAPDYSEPPEKTTLPDLNTISRSAGDAYYEALLRYKARGVLQSALAKTFRMARNTLKSDVAHALRLVQCGVLRLVEKDYLGMDADVALVYEQLANEANEAGYVPASLREEDVRKEKDRVKKEKIVREKTIDVPYYEGILQMRAQGEKTTWIAKCYSRNANTVTHDMRYALALAEHGKIRLLEENYGGRTDKFKRAYLAIVAKSKESAQEIDATASDKVDCTLRPE